MSQKSFLFFFSFFRSFSRFFRYHSMHPHSIFAFIYIQTRKHTQTHTKIIHLWWSSPASPNKFVVFVSLFHCLCLAHTPDSHSVRLKQFSETEAENTQFATASKPDKNKFLHIYIYLFCVCIDDWSHRWKIFRTNDFFHFVNLSGEERPQKNIQFIWVWRKDFVRILHILIHRYIIYISSVSCCFVNAFSLIFVSTAYFDEWKNEHSIINDMKTLLLAILYVMELS